jgi:chromosome segregation ATPase
MKNFLQGLLIFFSLCLCGLLAYQWVRETHRVKEIQTLNDTIHTKAEQVQSLEVTARRYEGEIQRLDALKNDLNATIKTNKADIAKLAKDLERSETEAQRSAAAIETYKDALEKANASIKQQNENIRIQNEEMKKFAEERNEIVKKFNALAAEHNDLVTKWNKQQEELAASATNAPAKK